MKKRREKMGSSRSQTLPASPSHSFSNSSSSEFEFTVSHSPRATTSSALCPADDLFYKGLLLPLHLSPRLSMVRTLLLSSSSSSSAAAARDSTASSSTNDSHSSFSLVADCDSSRPSSVTEDDEFKSLNNNGNHHHHQQMKKNKYFSLSRFSSVFKKENNNKISSSSSSSVKKMSATAKEVIRKYMKKVKPLMGGFYTKTDRSEKINSASTKESSYHGGSFSHSFSGNLRYPKRRSCVSSCPSSMRSSPTHSGVLTRNGFQTMGINTGRVGPGGGNIGMHYSDMEELQSAIQGAIAHCKNSLLQNKSTVLSNEI